ncbi:MAG: hypothetical protein EWV91_15110 [Microcystis aeruginosa Ma_QC_Ca_00000000_S207]|uniref:Uncharacterized protein n=1 Tax=Microcystis aeruginosa Ma_QC_Ca_00000000_S207 TaxID=2486251 RepID=A0A552FER3_MICAE|nr:MAG: hypothetical protein EWV91_15110 [Microcystis aeruginosa Ma_QC_Ca_00000000_S207]
MSVVALIEFYFKLIICITIPEEPLFLLINSSTIFCKLIYRNLKKYINLPSLGQQVLIDDLK